MSNKQYPQKEAFLLKLLKALDARTSLAFSIIIFAIAGITGLSITIIEKGAPEDVEKRASLVFNATLPLLGTWVGTVLAYYFANENFQAASESNQKLAELNLQANNNSNDLPFMIVEAAMIPKTKIFFVSDVNTQLSEIIKSLDDKKIRRLPILDNLDNDGKIVGLVYYEDISKYINSETAKENLQEPPNLDKIKELKLQNYLNDNPNTYSNFAIVSPKASLTYAKEAMKLRYPDCRDVFVTKDGTDASPVVGYLTNIDFEKFSKR